MGVAALGRTVAAACAAGGAVLATEIAVARRRDYLFEAPEDALDGTFGTGYPVTLVVVGDSTAAGVGAGSRSSSYPAVLARRIAATTPVRLEVLGRSGLRMGGVPELCEAAAALAPDVVVIAAGANDAIHVTPLAHVRSALGRALDVLARSSDASVLVVAGPRLDCPALPRPLRDVAAARCRAVNRVLRRESAARGVGCIDLEPLIGDAFARHPRRYYSEDLFHPGPEGYALWADAAAPLIAAAIAARADGRGRTAPTRVEPRKWE